MLHSSSAPFAVIAITGLVFLFPVENRGRLGPRRLLGRVDMIGSCLLLASTVLLVIALQEAGSLVVAWNSLLVLVSLTLAAISFALFMGWESLLSSGDYWRIEPVFPLRLLQNRVYFACLMYGYGSSSPPKNPLALLTCSDQQRQVLDRLCIPLPRHHRPAEISDHQRRERLQNRRALATHAWRHGCRLSYLGPHQRKEKPHGAGGSCLVRVHGCEHQPPGHS